MKSTETIPAATYSEEEALSYHAHGRPGKFEIAATKPMATQKDLSLAYSPGVAAPVRAIADNPDRVYDYTTRGNMVAVISNGTAILGMGDLGPLASKPVMEGKVVLLKRFADLDAIDLEVDTKNIDEFINCVRYLEPSFGGINLEDIAAPACFIIEKRLREIMNIPVFHDDQHGTAIICLAGFINALTISGRKIDDVKIVTVGAGSAGIACINLLKRYGVPHGNIMLLDKGGVVHPDRAGEFNEWQLAHAIDTDKRTLAEALTGADMFLGLSAANILSVAMLHSMAPDPIIFAMANPDPEIHPEIVRRERPDAIVATGRSDYPNQINNVLGFPYLFRGALDVRATGMNEEMKIAAAEALAQLAREDVPDEVAEVYSGRRLCFGPDYVIPAPFDPRLISLVPAAVAQAAMDTGIARRPIADLDTYRIQLKSRRDPIAGSLQHVFERVRDEKKRIVFAEGEEERMIRAARSFVAQKLGTAILIGKSETIKSVAKDAGIELGSGIEIVNAANTSRNSEYIDSAYKLMQRSGMLRRDCQRLVHNDRNCFGASMLTHGDADGMVTGLTRNYSVALDDVRRMLPPNTEQPVFGVSMLLSRERTVFIADTSVHEMPDARLLADIAVRTVSVARQLGHFARVALLSYSTFGHPEGLRSKHVRQATRELEKRNVDFEFDGEMAADVALESDLLEAYPFSRLTAPANILIMPAINSAAISTQLMRTLGKATVIGPILIGLQQPIQILPLNARDTDIVNMAALAAYNIGNFPEN